MKKNKIINTSVLSQIAGIGNASRQLEEIGDKQIFSEDNLFNFSFNVDRSLVDFIRKFVDIKRSNPDEYHYNQSDAIREGIKLLKEANIEIGQRPRSVKIPTRKGRTFGSTVEDFNKVEKIKTSFRINEIEKEYIYDFIYSKATSEKPYGKEDFLEELTEALKQKYNVKA
jgi:Arc/MetJ-type ribon-helix-helix transcriptional regulator